MSGFLPVCRHKDPKAPPGPVCELQPGVLVCPCLGPAKDPVAKLYVDAAGQLVWTALGKNGEPSAHFTFVALRRAADGKVEQVRLQQVSEVPLTTQEKVGVFSVQPVGDGSSAAISVTQFMEHALRGDEFVFLQGG